MTQNIEKRKFCNLSNKQRNFFTNIKKSSEDSVTIKCLVKASKNLCPDKKRVFEGINFS